MGWVLTASSRLPNIYYASDMSTIACHYMGPLHRHTEESGDYLSSAKLAGAHDNCIVIALHRQALMPL